ncbi:MAG: hypothetical protein ACI9DC_003347 [Gammaproteobacteria bacterium]|jgi:hypothetical protein
MRFQRHDNLVLRTHRRGIVCDAWMGHEFLVLHDQFDAILAYRLHVGAACDQADINSVAAEQRT